MYKFYFYDINFFITYRVRCTLFMLMKFYVHVLIYYSVLSYKVLIADGTLQRHRGMLKMYSPKYNPVE